MAELQNSDTKRKRKPKLRFGLKLLLLAMLAASVVFAWFANELRQSRFEAELIKTAEAWNESTEPHFECAFDYEAGSQGNKIGKKIEPIGPAWIRSLFGQHVFSRIKSLTFDGAGFIKKPSIRDQSTLSPSNIHVIPLSNVKGLSLTELESLVSVNLRSFQELNDLAIVEQLTELEQVCVSGCVNFSSLGGIENLKQLKTVRVIGHRSKLNDVRPLICLNELELIDIDVDDSFPTQENWDALAAHPELLRLHVTGYDKARFSRLPGSRRKLSKFNVFDVSSTGDELGILSSDSESANPAVRQGKFRTSPNIEVLTIENIDPGLEDLGSFPEMPKLHHLEIRKSMCLRSLEGLQHCKDLSYLKIEDCHNLRDISAIGQLKKLKTISITFSHKHMDSIPVLDCRDLEHLRLKGIHGFRDLEFLRNAENLRTLDLSDSGVRSLKGLYRLGLLERLLVDGSELTSIGCDVIHAPLTSLDLEDCDLLIGLDGLENFEHLSSVNLKGCMELKRLKGLLKLTDMTFLDLTDCRSLKSLDDLKTFSQLEHVIVKGCISLENIDGLMDLPQLKSFDWSDCPRLKTAQVERLRKKFPSLDESADILDRKAMSYPRR